MQNTDKPPVNNTIFSWVFNEDWEQDGGRYFNLPAESYRALSILISKCDGYGYVSLNKVDGINKAHMCRLLGREYRNMMSAIMPLIESRFIEWNFKGRVYITKFYYDHKHRDKDKRRSIGRSTLSNQIAEHRVEQKKLEKRVDELEEAQI